MVQVLQVWNHAAPELSDDLQGRGQFVDSTEAACIHRTAELVRR